MSFSVLPSIRSIPAHLEKLGSRIEVVSFDVFDTMLLRIISPEAVVKSASQRLANKLVAVGGMVPTAEQIRQHRLDYKMTSEKHPVRGESEWLVEEWLASLAKDWRLDTEQVCRLGLDAEMSAERCHNRVVTGAPELLRTLSERGYRLMALSDTTLNAKLLRELLEGFGIHFETVFSSGTLKRSKRKGGGFPHVSRRLGLPARAFLQVGDNWKADFVRPTQHGWNSVWVPHRRPEAPVWTWRSRGIRGDKRAQLRAIGRALSADSAPSTSHPLFRIGHDTIAPVLILLTLMQWRLFTRHSVSLALFMARDAFTMFDVANRLIPLLPGFPPIRYVRLSRRAISLAHPGDLLPNLRGLPGKMGWATFHELLSGFDLDPELRSEILNRAAIQVQDSIAPTSLRRLKSALEQLGPQLSLAQSKQRSLIREYLFQQADGASLARIGVVDSGCAATTQEAIAASVNEAEATVGCYLAVSNHGSRPNACLVKYGLLRDDFRRLPHSYAIDRLAGIVRLWDVILQEPIGTVVKLQRGSDGLVKPILAHHAAFSGPAREAYTQIRRGVGAGTAIRCDGIRALVDLCEDWSDGVFEAAAASMARSILSRPTKRVADALFDLRIEEAGGRQTSIGLSGLKEGIAWYPGLLARYRLRAIQPLLEAAAEVTAEFITLRRS